MLPTDKLKATRTRLHIFIEETLIDGEEKVLWTKIDDNDYKIGSELLAGVKYRAFTTSEDGTKLGWKKA